MARHILSGAFLTASPVTGGNPHAETRKEVLGGGKTCEKARATAKGSAATLDLDDVTAPRFCQEPDIK